MVAKCLPISKGYLTHHINDQHTTTRCTKDV